MQIFEFSAPTLPIDVKDFLLFSMVSTTTTVDVREGSFVSNSSVCPLLVLWVISYKQFRKTYSRFFSKCSSKR